MTSKMILSLILICAFSCNRERPEVTSTDQIKLKEIISIKFEPESVVWTEVGLGKPVGSVPGLSDSYIVCILSYDSTTFGAIKNEFNGVPSINNRIYLKESFMRDWFPSSVKNNFFKEGSYLRIRANAYPSNIFFKLPYLSGFCFFTTDGKIFITMYST